MTVEQQDKIEDYLNDQMSSTEKIDFEKQIEASKALADEVNRCLQMRIFAKNRDIIQAKALLESVMADIHIEPAPKEPFWQQPIWRWLGGGCLVLALTGSLFLYQQSQEKKAWFALSKTHLKKMEDIEGFNANNPIPAARGMQAYDNGNYEEAIALLSVGAKQESDDKMLSLYLAISYLMQGKNIDSEKILQELIKNEGLETTPAKWYLALSLLQHGQKNEAKALLQSLESDTIYGNQAKEILKELK